MSGAEPIVFAVRLAMLAAAPPEELPPEHATIDPKRFRYRAASLVVGPRVTFPFVGPCASVYDCPPGALVGFSAEAGSRLARLLVELYSAPVPYFSGDVAVVEGINLGVGGLFGDERFRGGATLVLGYSTFVAGDVRFLAAPWVGRRGGRHGLEARAGVAWFGVVHVGLHYRWFPAALNRYRERPTSPHHPPTPARQERRRRR